MSWHGFLSKRPNSCQIPSSPSSQEVIVFYQGSYGIFDVTELGVLSGMRLKASQEDRESAARILERYRIDPSP